MNFKKIEWVFVIAFLGLNFFLFFLYREGVIEGSDVASSNQTESIETLLKNDQITFSGALSEERQSGYYLSAEPVNLKQALADKRKENSEYAALTKNTSYTEYSLNHHIEEKQLLKKDAVKGGIEAFLNEQRFVLFGNEYQYLEKLSSFTEEESVAVAGQSFEGIPFNDDHARIQFTLLQADETYQIAEYAQSYITNISELREKMELYSEREAVQSLYKNSRLPKNSQILWTQLAYSRIMEVYDKDIYVPVWFVAIKTDNTQKIESVNALNNTVINTAVLKVASE